MHGIEKSGFVLMRHVILSVFCRRDDDDGIVTNRRCHVAKPYNLNTVIETNSNGQRMHIFKERKGTLAVIDGSHNLNLNLEFSGDCQSNVQRIREANGRNRFYKRTFCFFISDLKNASYA